MEGDGGCASGELIGGRGFSQLVSQRASQKQECGGRTGVRSSLEAHSTCQQKCQNHVIGCSWKEDVVQIYCLHQHSRLPRYYYT